MSDFIDNFEDTNIINDYYKWLFNQIKGFDERFANMSTMFYILCNVQFIAKMKEDTPRIKDAYELRYHFSRDIETDFLWVDDQIAMSASVAEVLVALAIRCDITVGNAISGPQPELYFWDFINNLGLNCFDNSAFEWSRWGKIDPKDSRNVIDILNIWMKRQFREDGFGSPFPLKNPPGNEKTTNLWYQMQAWIMENYAVN